jgi:hypothetical protein
MIDCSVTLRVHQKEWDDVACTASVTVNGMLYRHDVRLSEHVVRSQFDVMWKYVTDRLYDKLVADMKGTV